MGKKNKKNMSYEKVFKPKNEAKKIPAVQRAYDEEAIKEQVARVYQCKEEGKYEEALTAVIDLFNQGYVSMEILYQVIEIYYLIGDYDRAIVWGKKALSFDKNHVPALLRLGSIYAIKDENRDCLEMIQRVLCVDKDSISDDQLDTIDELLDYVHTDDDLKLLRERYPAIYEYLNQKNDMPLTETDSLNQANQGDDLQVCADAIDDDDSQDQASDCDDLAIAKAPVSEAERTVDQPLEPVGEADEAKNAADHSIEDLVASIMSQRVSLSEKVESCNSLACGYYEQGDFSRAVRLLEQALEIDRKDTRTLKNWAYMLVKCGERETALQCLLSMRSDDFMILDLIKELKEKQR